MAQTQETEEKATAVPADVSGSHSARHSAAWGLPSRRFSRWPAFLAVAACIALYYVLPARLVVLQSYRLVPPTLEALLLLPILATHMSDRWRHSAWKRPVFMLLIVLVSATNYAAVGLLVHNLTDGAHIRADELLLSAVEVWLTNVIVFGLWYWELDRGGPVARLTAEHPEPDFLFPQMVSPKATDKGWSPSFLDYLYVSFTNATAFSPTDTMPLTTWAKLLMMVQSAGSLLIVGVVGARAVNILQQ